MWIWKQDGIFKSVRIFCFSLQWSRKLHTTHGMGNTSFFRTIRYPYDTKDFRWYRYKILIRIPVSLNRLAQFYWDMYIIVPKTVFDKMILLWSNYIKRTFKKIFTFAAFSSLWLRYSWLFHAYTLTIYSAGSLSKLAMLSGSIDTCPQLASIDSIYRFLVSESCPSLTNNYLFSSFFLVKNSFFFTVFLHQHNGEDHSKNILEMSSCIICLIPDS